MHYGYFIYFKIEKLTKERFMKKSKIIIIISLFLVFTGILHAQTVTVTPETPSSQKQETTQNKDSEKEETKIQKEKK